MSATPSPRVRRLPEEKYPEGGRRGRLHELIYESDTREGKAFDIALLVAIFLSVVVVMLESVPEFDAQYGGLLTGLEWTFTLLFTVEYVLRLVAVRSPLRYATSFFGVVDLLAILPTYVSVLAPGLHALSVIRILRVLRIFRVFKLTTFVGEARALRDALGKNLHKIAVFLIVVITSVVITGAVMYLVEGPKHGFDTIPRAMYWAVVTVTTVGYGDISPQTPVGQFLASVLMILGYGIIAVPTGIITAGVVESHRKKAPPSGQACQVCSAEGHDPDAKHCKYCGAAL